MTKYASIFTATAFLIIPFGMWGSDVHQGHVYALIVAVVIGLALYLPNPFLSAFGLFAAGWMAYVFSMAWVGLCIPELTLVTIDGLLFIILGMLALLAVYHSKIDFDVWANIICTLALVQAAIGICQIWFDPVSTLLSYIVDVRGEYSFLTPLGTLGNKNFLGALLAVSLPFFFRDWWWMATPVIICGLFVVQTSTSAIAACIGFGYYYGGCRGVAAMVVPAVLYVIFWDQNNIHSILASDRFLFWKDAFVKIFSSWKTAVFGYGPGITWEVGNQLHNEYVMALWNYGLVGVGLMAAYILNAYRGNRIVFTAFIIICIDGVGNHLLHTTPTALLAVVVISLMERERHNSNVNK